jgi:hypothetical protein
MSALAHGTPAPRAVPELPPHGVSLFVADPPPLLQRKRALDWPALQAVRARHWRAAGKNVGGRPGLPWPVSLSVPWSVWMAVKALAARQMEGYGTEHVAARAFLDLAEDPLPPLREHAAIARAPAAWGTAGWPPSNPLVVTEAVRVGFGKPQLLSSATPGEEPQSGSPPGAGLLRGIAQRGYRAAVRLRNRGGQHAQAAIEKAKEGFSRGTDCPLFAKTKHATDQALKKILRHGEQLLSSSRAGSTQVGGASTRAAPAAVAKLPQLGEVSGGLLPQIERWRKTGKVARHKLLHPGITQARSIVKKRAGKRVAFGLKWWINRSSGGYIVGKVVDARAAERQLPLAALPNYRAGLGAQASPEMAVYDRGGGGAQTVEKRQKAGGKKGGIQPAGQAPWAVAAADQQEVGSQRGQAEGASGPSRAASTTAEGADSAATRAREQPGSGRGSV